METWSDEAPRPAPRERVRLAFGSLFRRLFVLLFLAGELVHWVLIRRQAPRRMRVPLLLIYTPRVMFVSFLVAAIVTVVADLFVRLAIHRQVRHWLSPPPTHEDDHQAFGFHIGADESIEGMIPARRLSRRRAMPGTLVKTDRRLWFFPRSWDAEPWSLPLGRIEAASTVPAPRVAWGMVRGLPPRLAVDEVPPEGAREVFVLADPEAALRWFRPARTPYSPHAHARG